MDVDLFRETLSSHSDDEFSSDSSEESEEMDTDDEDSNEISDKGSGDNGAVNSTTNHHSPISNNIIHKLYNREISGSFSGISSQRNYQQQAFHCVPNRLSFCLKDIVPNCFLQGHMFMGLSACGQFLLSYKVACNDNFGVNHYSFNVGYKYTLYFWVYQPHKPLRNFFKTCLFDDHGVDNLKVVTITQWKCTDTRVLIVHGAAEDENEDSYITYVKVPKLGCLECKKLREVDEEGYFHWCALCLKCNLTIHTKYSTTESDRKFTPYLNLICPGRILIIANGFLHMLYVDLELPSLTSLVEPISSPPHMSNSNASPFSSATLKALTQSPQSAAIEFVATVDRHPFQAAEEAVNCDNHNNIVARIIADFSDIETDSTHSNGSIRSNNELQQRSNISSVQTAPKIVPNELNGNISGVSNNTVSRKTYDELIFTCNGSAPIAKHLNAAPTVGCSSNIKTNNSNSGSTNNAVASGVTSKIGLINHKGKRHHRIVTKSYRNGVITVDMQCPITSTSSAATSSATDKSNAYEFSEDNEKCEKISTLRKRRLADKKYEFSEDNSENIIPFTKTRSAGKQSTTTSNYSVVNAPSSSHNPRNHLRSSAAAHIFSYSSPCASPSSSPHSSTHAAASNYETHHYSTTVSSNHSTTLLQRSSPITLQQGFRSPPCSSPIAGLSAVMRSPSRQISNATPIFGQKSPSHTSFTQSQIPTFKTLGALSPLQVSMSKRNYLDLTVGSMSPNSNVPFLSPRREEHRVSETPMQYEHQTTDKPSCTKKFKRRYVEEDDALSVITSEEDDCISPGYHTSLPMEVHGSCYSEMQMISQNSYQQLRCASIVITQHSFDLETFTYYVINTLCQKNEITYDVFYDWANEVIKVCPQSHQVICLLMAQFSARDQLPATHTNCINCSRKIDCAFHRRQYECRILFTWNMETGEWIVLDYGELVECKFTKFPKVTIINPPKRIAQEVKLPLADKAKKHAHEMEHILNNIDDYYIKNLRVLDSTIKKSKMCLVDHDNMIEFHLKRQRPSN